MSWEDTKRWLAENPKEPESLSDERLGTLTAHLHNADDPEGCMGAIMALRVSGDPRAAAPLVRCLAEDDIEIHKAARDALISLGSDAAPALCDALATSDGEHYARVEQTLVRVGEPAVETLGVVAKGDNQSRALRACDVLSRIGSVAAFAHLEELGRTAPSPLREYAAELSGKAPAPAKSVSGKMRAPAMPARSAPRKAATAAESRPAAPAPRADSQPREEPTAGRQQPTAARWTPVIAGIGVIVLVLAAVLLTRGC